MADRSTETMLPMARADSVALLLSCRPDLADPAALSIEWSPITGGQYVGDGGGPTGVTAPASGTTAPHATV